jgi:hypothetical protein
MRVWPALVLALIAVAATGCGLGAGPTPSGVQLTVTRDFGAHVLHRSGSLAVRGQETAMSLLQRNYRVGTRYGGGFVESIDGLAGGHDASAQIDWFYYDNGVQASQGAAATDVHPGDRIWWDRHDWSQTEDVPAVVGSFPEPFLSGIAGKRLPVRIECEQVGGYACRTVVSRLREAGVPAAVAGLGVTGGPLTLRVLVGAWSHLAGDGAARMIQAGTRESGVYAHFSGDGHTLTPLSPDGRALASLGAGTGLIAATRHAEDAPVWLVTGTDAQGVELAARDFDAATLTDRFAVAVTPGATHPLPEVPG